MSADWYRQRFGSGGRQAPQPARPAPKFVIGQDGRAYEVAPQGEAPPGWGQPAQQYPQAPGAGLPSQVGVPMGQTRASEGIALWRGTADAQNQGGGCPRCGSPNYFAQMQAGLGDGQGGESGKLSMGHCFQCGYRQSSGRGYTATPSEQPRGLNGIKAGEIPTYEARSPNMPAFGGFEVFAKVG